MSKKNSEILDQKAKTTLLHMYVSHRRASEAQRGNLVFTIGAWIFEGESNDGECYICKSSVGHEWCDHLSRLSRLLIFKIWYLSEIIFGQTGFVRFEILSVIVVQHLHVC